MDIGAVPSWAIDWADPTLYCQGDFPMKTDAELVKLCATKVMGWVEGKDFSCPNGEDIRIIDPHYNALTTNPIYWNPLHNEQDSAMVLEMAAEGEVFIEWRGHYWEIYGIAESCDIDRKRAIVLAALKAKGIEV